MFACRRARGLIAAALYEPLERADQVFLDNHLGRCDACRSEQAGLVHFVEALPQGTEVAEVDLLPALRQRMANQERDVVWPAPRMVWAGAVGAVVIAGAIWLLRSPAGDVLPVAPTEVAGAGVATEVRLAMDNADDLLRQHRPKEAFLALKSATESYPDAPETASALLTMADLSFDELHWYKESYAIHKTLLSKHLEAVKKHPEADRLQERLNELAEASKEDYEPLFRLDEARADRSGGFAKLESLAAAYPGKFIAHDAVMAMAQLVAQENGAAPLTKTAALEATRSRCAKPLAKNQVAWELAQAYGAGQDPSKAAVWYGEVAKGPDTELARMAKAALVHLSGPSQSPK